MKRIGYPTTLGTGRETSYPFGQLFDESVEVQPEQVKAGEVDAIVIWGGADISPSIYGHRVSRFTGASENMSYRDLVEHSLVLAALHRGIPIIGVCRGAQLVCAMSGGSLVQHVDGHAGSNHGIITDDGRSIVSNSLHHQMMNPFDVDHRLLAWADGRRSEVYIGQDNVDIPGFENNPEPEVVYFPKTNALAIQGHPEFMNRDTQFVAYSLELTTKLLNGEL